MKSNQKNTLFALVLLGLALATVEADLLLTLTTYIWRWFIYGNVIASSFGCWLVGGWGLFWDDDDGLMIDRCMKMWGGSTVTFAEIEYELN